MKYDSYNRETYYKPGVQIRCRDRLHRLIFTGLGARAVLEIGAGFGELAHWCRRRGIAWTGIEPNAALREPLVSDGFPVYDATMPEFPEIVEEFDTIFAAHFIEHMNGLDEVTRFLAGCRDRLGSRGGGRLILLYPDIEKCGAIFWHDYTHAFPTTKKRVEDLLFDQNWRIVRSTRYTACFIRGSGLISAIGRVFPFFLLPRRVALFARLSFLRHVLTIAEPDSRTGPARSEP